MIHMTFACMAAPGKPARQALLLAHSIRVFAGHYANAPIRVLVPRREPLADAVHADLRALDVHITPFEIDGITRRFPFAAKVYAAAVAETDTSGASDVLVWMDSDALVLNDPDELRLDEGVSLGYRPVDHTLIGSPWRRPADAFWRLIYRHCAVADERLFPMTATVDRQQIRPYFNAGLLVVRPERGLFMRWRESFEQLYMTEEFATFYREHALYQVFFHQAILAGTVLGMLAQEELVELPPEVNYPLHMHSDYPADRRPAALDALVSCRYETFFDAPDWIERIPANDALRDWLIAHL